jgi:hypothetical protein
VILADLAEVIVKAIGRADEVDDPSDPQSWIEFLASIGVPIDTIGLALDNVEPLAEPVAGYVARVSTDPLQRDAVFGQPDEPEFGADMAYVPVRMTEVVELVVTIPDIPRRPRPVTPVDR